MFAFYQSLQTILASTGVLFVSLFLLLLGGGLQGSLVGIRGADEGFSTLVLSLISSGFYVGFFAGSIVVPTLLKRVGYIRVFAALVALASVAAIIYPMYIDRIVWFAMRLLTGFCFAGIYIVCESWLNSQTHNDNRAKVLGLYMIVIFLGMTVGQFLLNFGEISGYFLFALGSVIVSVASVPLLLTKRAPPTIEESSVNLSIRKLYRRSPLGTMTVFAANFINGSIVGLSAIYAKNLGLPTEQIAWFVASAYIGVIVFQLPIGYLSDRVDRRKIIILICVCSVIVSVFAMLMQTIWQLTVIFGILGGVALPLYSIGVAYVNDRLKPEEILPATSAIVKISGAANVAGPIVSGWLMVQLGEHWFFGTVSVVSLALAILGLYRTTKPGINIEDQSEFAPIGAMTATAATMSLAHEGIQLEFDFGEAYQKAHINTEQHDKTH